MSRRNYRKSRRPLNISSSRLNSATRNRIKASDFPDADQPGATDIFFNIEKGIDTWLKQKQSDLRHGQVWIEFPSKDEISFTVDFELPGDYSAVEFPVEVRMTSVPTYNNYYDVGDYDTQIDCDAIAAQICREAVKKAEQVKAEQEVISFAYERLDRILSREGFDLQEHVGKAFNDNKMMIEGRNLSIRFYEIHTANGEKFLYSAPARSFNDSDLVRWAQDCAQAVVSGIDSGELEAIDIYVDEDVNSSRRVNSNRGSGKLNSSRQLPYQAISIPVILRDWTTLNDGDYFSRKHQKLVDIGDTLYNDGMEMAEYLKPEYKELYEEFGEAFWKQVVEDAAAIDSQMSREKVEELDQEYTDLSFRIM